MLIAGLSLKLLAVLWAGAFLGGLATGGAGFAYALCASAIWLHVLDPLHTTALLVTSGTLLQFVVTWPIRRSIQFGRLAPFALGGLLGIPVGVGVLSFADLDAVRIAVGSFLVAYGAYALVTPRLPLVTGGGRGADAAIGFAGGVLGGIGGYSGILPTIWTQLRGWTKESARGVFQPFILLANVVTVALLGAVALDRTTLVMSVAILPALALGTWIGWRIYERLDERSFRRALALLLFVSGLILVAPKS